MSAAIKNASYAANLILIDKCEQGDFKIAGGAISSLFFVLAWRKAKFGRSVYQDPALACILGQ
jgi:hypothetical protein